MQICTITISNDNINAKDRYRFTQVVQLIPAQQGDSQKPTIPLPEIAALSSGFLSNTWVNPVRSGQPAWFREKTPWEASVSLSTKTGFPWDQALIWIIVGQDISTFQNFENAWAHANHCPLIFPFPRMFVVSLNQNIEHQYNCKSLLIVDIPQVTDVWN